jgi:hypothetical protein
MEQQMHIPYGELPVEARMLFYIFALGTSPNHLHNRPTFRGFSKDLAEVWDEHRVVTSDLSDPSRMTSLLRRHFRTSAADSALQAGTE